MGAAALENHIALYHPQSYCEQCDREFNSDGALQQHLRESPVHRLSACGECGAQFKGGAALEEHMDSNHPLPYCVPCDREFGTDAALQQHLKESSVHKVYTCEECRAQCIGVAALDKHMDKYHPVFWCEKCDLEFNTEAALQQHLREASAHVILPCEECGTHCFGIESLEEHMEHFHPDPYCEPCDLDFDTAEELQHHLRESPEHRVIACEECGVECIGEAALEEHWDEFHPLPYCESCDREFDTEQGLQQHLRTSSAHTTPVFPCSKCDRTFDSKHALRQHLSSPAHVHRCEECNKEFASATSLQQHLSSPLHTHQCAPCGITFTSQASLHQHLRSSSKHTALQPEGANCCICFAKPKDAALVPCGHRMCFECGRKVRKERRRCPICNKSIGTVMRLFG